MTSKTCAHDIGKHPCDRRYSASLSFGTGIHKIRIYDMSLGLNLRVYAITDFERAPLSHGFGNLCELSVFLASNFVDGPSLALDVLVEHLIYLRFSARAFGFEIDFFDSGEKKPLCGSIFIVPPAAFAMLKPVLKFVKDNTSNKTRER